MNLSRIAAEFQFDMVTFIERLIGTLRREYLDQTFFWNVSTCIGTWTDSPAITTTGAFTPDGMAERPLECCSTTAGAPANLHRFAVDRTG